jgi:protease YdgD
MRLLGKIFPAVLGVLALLPIIAQGQSALEGLNDSALTSLQTGDDAHGWEAVGRLDIGGKGFCTGSLIAIDLVLTAAHCLYDRDSGALIDPARMEFLAGMRNGRALAYRNVSRAVAHPDYIHSATGDPGGSTLTGSRRSGMGGPHDLALLQLSQPIRSTQIMPYALAAQADIGTEVGIVSYAYNRAEAPALQEVCAVLAQESGMLVMSCDVDFGSSGAPVFVTSGGVSRIVSVIAAKGELDGMGVAIGTVLEEPLVDLRAAMGIAMGGGTFQANAPGNVRVLGGGERADTGAKFVRP